MKKNLLFPAVLTLALSTWSCNDNRETSSSGSNDSGNNMNTGGDTVNRMDNSNTANNTTGNNTANTTPLSKADSMFVIEAAVGGMMEVESGNFAQQNATSQRVKDFGSMMVTDHGKANQELTSLASSHGITLPTSLPADVQKHIDQMKKMTGKAFDQHYVNMMVTDHQKDIAKFKKQSTSGASDDLKTWATNTLPVLQKHMDSIQAIKKRKM